MKNDPTDHNPADTPTEVPPKTLEEMGRLLFEMRRDYKKMDYALFGDKYDQEKKPGLFTMFVAMHDDYYGRKDRGIRGTKIMTEIMWELRFKIFGGAIALGAAGSFLAWLIETKLLDRIK